MLCNVMLCYVTMVSDCGRMEVITGSITAEVDVPTSQRVLASLDIIGTVGTAKLHVPKNKPVMCRYILFRLLQLLSSRISLKLAHPLKCPLVEHCWSGIYLSALQMLFQCLTN